MKVLVIGDDGRAHTLVWKLFNSPLADEVIGTPGNGGVSQLVPCVHLDLHDHAEVGRWAFAEQIDLIIPATSQITHSGLVDELRSLHIHVCAPPHTAAYLEQSRCAAKAFLLRHQLPTPLGQPFDNLPTAEKYLAAQPLPIVLKADHPDAGGGIYDDRYSALTALRELFETQVVGGRNNGVLIEAYVPGVRLSLSSLTDGQTTRPFLPTRIYHRLWDGDDAPVAPAMGAHTGTSAYARKLTKYLHRHLLLPLVHALAQESISYCGILGIDCLITEHGPSIISICTSMHDMEAQVVLPRLDDDLLPFLQATATGTLDQTPPLQWRDEASVAIALVAEGYPHHFPIGSPIDGLADLDDGILVFHHETTNPFGLRYTQTVQRESSLATFIMGEKPDHAPMSTTGGHVLSVVALGATLAGARGRALINADRIRFAGRFYREDIGQREFT